MHIVLKMTNMCMLVALVSFDPFYLCFTNTGMTLYKKFREKKIPKSVLKIKKASISSVRPYHFDFLIKSDIKIILQEK